jgi:PAS domain S-box-containing protein
MVAMLCAQGHYDAAVELETLWNGLARRLRFSLFCAYPLGLFSGTERALAFQQLRAAHQHEHVDGPADIDGEPAASAARLAALEQRCRAAETELARARATEQALLRREKELTDFIENAAEGLHRVDGDGKILWANKAELQMLGYRRDEYVGHNVADFHVDKPVIDDIFARLRSGETLHDRPARLRCKDGSIKQVVVSSNAYFEDGRICYTRCFTRDATERHERDQAVTQRNQVLLDAGKAKDEFLAMLGHELRNPLAPIVTALQLMRLRGDQHNLLERQVIQRQVDHLVRLVDDLLDVSRVTRGKIELKIEPVELAEAIAKAVEMARPLLDERRHELELRVTPGLAWEGDPARLAQVLANLLTNAARYTPAGGQVLLRAWADGPHWIKLSVTDNGNGLAPDMLSQVFELFVQGDRGLDRAEGGLGIGLALVKNIVELHGGAVEARSDGPGKGSEFLVRLPTRASVEAPARAPMPAPAAAAAPARLRCMVVDDNADAATLLAQLLAALGHDVRVFNDPLAALEAAADYRPELALLDIGLPGMDGYELVQALRERLGSQPCSLVALSGYGQSNDRARSAAVGFTAHMVKPISLEQLMGVIDACGQRRR